MDECHLPEELLRKIFARIPYPAIYRVRCLSKRWRFILSADSNDDNVKAFQDEVKVACSAWPSYALLQIWEGAFLGYDVRAGEWSTLPLQLGCHYDALTHPQERWKFVVRSSGSLVCWHDPHTSEGIVSVANVITGKLKHLTAPEMSLEALGLRGIYIDGWKFVDLVFHSDTDGFTVVLIYDVSNREISQFRVMFRVYESRTASWWSYHTARELWSEDLNEHNSVTMKVCPVLVEQFKLVVVVMNAVASFVVGVFYVKRREWAYFDHQGDPEHRLKFTMSFESSGWRVILMGSKYKGVDDGSCSENTFVFEFSECTERVLLIQGKDEIIMHRGVHSPVVSYHAEEPVCISVLTGWDCKESEWEVTRFDKETMTLGYVCGPIPDRDLQQGDEARGYKLVHGVLSPKLNPFYDPSAVGISMDLLFDRMSLRDRDCP